MNKKQTDLFNEINYIIEGQLFKHKHTLNDSEHWYYSDDGDSVCFDPEQDIFEITVSGITRSIDTLGPINGNTVTQLFLEMTYK